MLKALMLLTFSFCISKEALAEYRVYQYYVRSKISFLTNPKATLITSTLDPSSYAVYNGGASSIEVNLLRSWICLGNTSKKAPCTISEGKELNEGFEK